MQKVTYSLLCLQSYNFNFGLNLKLDLTLLSFYQFNLIELLLKVCKLRQT